MKDRMREEAFNDWWAEFTARFAPPRHVSDPNVMARAFGQYQRVVMAYSPLVMELAMDELLRSESRTWPTIAEVEAALRGGAGMERGRAGSGRGEIFDMRDIRERSIAFMEAFGRSRLALQAKQEGWWWELRSFAQRCADMQAQIISRARRENRSLSAGDRQTKEQCDRIAYYSLEAMERDGNISVDVTTAQIAGWKESAKQHDEIERAGGGLPMADLRAKIEDVRPAQQAGAE